MIDYLEALFTPETRAETAGEEPLPRAPAARADKDLEQPETGTMTPGRGEEFWQEEAVRRLESAMSEQPAAQRRLSSVAPEEMALAGRSEELPEEAVRESARFYRSRTVGVAESLEHRLRRDSRRYDSGFFWY